MVRTLPRPLLSELDGKRIAATSGAIALHVLALGLLLAPVSWEEPVAHVSEPPPVLHVVPVEVKVRPIPPPLQVPVTRPRTRPTPVTTPTQVREETPPVDLGTEEAQAVVDSATNDFAIADHGEPVMATLAYLYAPPPAYPRQALRAGLTGTVLLRVQIDSTGRPTAVTIEQGSGHRLLDQVAREQVLARWRFQPAMRDGQAIAAQALVPIEFNLPQ